MGKLQKRFYTSSSNAKTVNKGTEVPKWANNFKKENWWYTSPDVWYHYSLANENTGMYIQQGGNMTGWASVVFYGESVILENEVENDDGSITVDVKYRGEFYASRKTDYATGGVRSKSRVLMNGEVVYSHDGLSTDERQEGATPTKTKTVTIQPDKANRDFLFEIIHEYPNGEFPNSNLKLGIEIYNPNPPEYTPHAIVKGGVVVSNESSKRKIQVVSGGNVVDISKESVGTIGHENKGHNRLVKNDKIIQVGVYK